MTRSILLACALAAVIPLHAQAQPRVPDAVMLKRIAEAVDGVRSGERVYVVASYDSAHQVQAVVSSRTMATQMIERLGPGGAMFGPYQTEAEPDSVVLVIGCWHDGYISRITCPNFDSTFAASDVVSWQLTARLRNGRTRFLTLPGKADAIFMTPAAFDKFAVPYYVRIMGLESTVDLRTRSLRRP